MAANGRKRNRLSRRAVLSFLTGVPVGVAANELTPAVDRLLGLKKLAPQPALCPPEILERAELVYQLFLSSPVSRTEFIPPGSWLGGPPNVRLPGGTYTYQHEAEVLKSIASFLGSARLAAWQPVNLSWVPHDDNSQVLLGSGASNAATEAIFGRPESPHLSPGSRLHYLITLGRGQFLRWQYGQEIERQAYGICGTDRKVLVQADGRGGWLQEDYLLVTRMPGKVRGTVLTVFAGLHGPGTRATELLFRSLSLDDLRTLADCIGAEPGLTPFYQAVFRASRFERGISDVATHIELVRHGCPPRPLKREAWAG